jgi:hypothetical protein
MGKIVMASLVIPQGTCDIRGLNSVTCRKR